MKPEDVLKLTEGFLSAIDKMKKSYVAVGLPNETASSRVYGNGLTVLQNGAHHEFGTEKVPQRSFVRLPFIVKQKDMKEYVQKMMNAVFEGKYTTEKALGLVGKKAENIIIDAFQTGCWGQWPPLKEATKRAKAKRVGAKRSDMILVDTTVLESSINYIVRNGV